MDRKLIDNYFDIRLIVSVIFQIKSTKNCRFNLVNVRICCFSVSFMVIDEESLFQTVVWRKEAV